MKVVMLAAGAGARLGYTVTKPPPKILLRFDGKSLLQYHIEILRRHGIGELVLGVGYQHRDIWCSVLVINTAISSVRSLRWGHRISCEPYSTRIIKRATSSPCGPCATNYAAQARSS
jgi:hypothetical protein